LKSRDYFPQEVFAGEAPARYSPRVLIAPQRYIQGKGVLDQVGRFLSVVPSTRPALLISERGLKRLGRGLFQSLGRVRVKPVTRVFAGECSDEEIKRHVAQLRGHGVDALIAVGGGKCLDAGKCVAHCLAVPAVICPTLASTDAPCSAVSVMYTPEGSFDRPWFFPNGPALVVVDTGVVVRAPVRYLVSGMGDAMSTFYEARTCFRNPGARTMIGARPTAAAVAIAELGARLLFENGVRALEAAAALKVNEAVENVVETNTLLSGIGFESGGLAAAHGVAQVMPMIPYLHKNYLHGEMVAMGLLTHLCLEGQPGEARRIAEFFAEVGLPVHLGHLSLSADRHDRELDGIVREALKIFFVHNEPFKVTAQKLKRALVQAHRLGMEVSREMGDEAYRRLHGAGAE